MHFEIDTTTENGAGRRRDTLRDDHGEVVRVANPALARRERMHLRLEGQRARVLRVTGRVRRQER